MARVYLVENDIWSTTGLIDLDTEVKISRVRILKPHRWVDLDRIGEPGYADENRRALNTMLEEMGTERGVVVVMKDSEIDGGYSVGC